MHDVAIDVDQRAEALFQRRLQLLTLRRRRGAERRRLRGALDQVGANEVAVAGALDAGVFVTELGQRVAQVVLVDRLLEARREAGTAAELDAGLEAAGQDQGDQARAP